MGQKEDLMGMAQGTMEFEEVIMRGIARRTMKLEDVRGIAQRTTFVDDVRGIVQRTML